MAEPKDDERPEEEIPAGQKFFDRIFLLLILSLLISILIYNTWGLFELF